MADTINYRFRCRRRTKDSWKTLNEILLAQEIGIESDTSLGKIGDGSTAWNSLRYSILSGIDLTNLQDGQCLAWNEATKTWTPSDIGSGSGGDDTLTWLGL